MAAGKRSDKRMEAGSAVKGERTKDEAGNRRDENDRAYRKEAEDTATDQRAIQEEALEKSEQHTREKERKPTKEEAMQAGERKYPANPLPEQHQDKPGVEAELDPRPKYMAPHYRGSGKLEDKVALITGADSGIGRAVAVLYAREGADIAIAYLSEHGDARETKQAVEAEGRRTILIAGDVSDPQFCRDAVARTVNELGKLDILVNNAAFQQHAHQLEDVSDEQWDRTFKTNIYGYFYMAKAALKHLKKGGAIVNSGSITGIEGKKTLLDYSATKGAIHAFTMSLGASLVERGIRVNCVAPGPVWTPLNPADSPAEEVAHFGEKTGMKRPAQPEELAPAYVFLASNADSSYITGEILPVIGGKE